MSANKKKRIEETADMSSKDEDMNDNDNNKEEVDDDDIESEDSDGMDSLKEKEEVIIDFEGRAPVDTDAEGISQLLQRLVPRAQINCNQLAELLIAQNFVGSVICQCMDDGPDTETDDNMVEDDTIFGITSVINLSAKKDKPVVEQLRKYLVQRAEKHATKQVKEKLEELLDNEQQHVGLLINERFMNIPSQICVPLLENLHMEIEAAKKKNMKYNFNTLLMLSKFQRMYGKKGKLDEILFTNAEDELLAERSLFDFEFPVDADNEADSCPEDEGGHKLYQKLLALEAKQLPQLINDIEAYISGE